MEKGRIVNREYWRQGEYGIEDVDGGQENERMMDEEGGQIEIGWMAKKVDR
jgi:hypothetical protein